MESFIVVRLSFVAPPMAHVISRHTSEDRATLAAVEHGALIAEVPSFYPYDPDSSHPLHAIPAKRWIFVQAEDVKP